ncbi:MAG: ATP-binding protein [Pirellulales bacterium]|nr:ATP-binding protein [Pirellulales bacterium]
MPEPNWNIDQPGSFYLGRPHDLKAGETSAEPLMYDSKDLTTHAVCVGMTGSGKTGLCLALMEEAALHGIPVLAIDPKGDLGNLLLAFPNLAASDFRPWIDEGEAARQGLSADDFAAKQAEVWAKGLAQWGQGAERVRRFCDSADRVIYTPGSSAGIPITVLKSFAAPPKELVADADAFVERVSSATSGLLALLGIEADPVRSREHIFLSSLLGEAWRAGRDVDLRELIQAINRPPLSTVGEAPLESFFPEKERTKLAMSLNNLLASPAFVSWLDGEPLDIQRMLYTPEGKPRLAIVSIAHLDDAQRMFFVTILLNEVLAWVRMQPGTSGLRAMLYMDEVFGYFPPVGNPPSKRPMLTLLKQARAYGLGCVLATQNPVDLDYKGLSNAGTWFLGRLQTERDKARVIEGLEGASAQAGAAFNRQEMEAALAALGKRVFLMNNVHENAPIVFQSRWALSYLCGPLTKNQIKTLMDPVRGKFKGAAGGNASGRGGGAKGAEARGVEAGPAEAGVPGAGVRPIVPAGIREVFVEVADRVPEGYVLEYRPGLLGKGKVHFVRKADNIDVWRTCFLTQTKNEAPIDDVWQGASSGEVAATTESVPDDRGQFAALPAEFAREKSYAIFLRQLKEHLYREESLKLWECVLPAAISKPGEQEAEFRARLLPSLERERAAQRDAVEKQYAKKLADAATRVAKAQSRVNARWWQRIVKVFTVLWVAIDTALAAFKINMPGRRRSLDPAIRSMATESGQSSNAKLDLERAQQEQRRLEQEKEDKLKQWETSLSAAALKLEVLELKPQKGDIEVDQVALAWFPYRMGASGVAEPVYDVAGT